MSGSAAQVTDEAEGLPLTTAYAARLPPSGSTLVLRPRDELIDDRAVPHGHTADLAATIEHLGSAGLLTRRSEAARLVEDEGVTYGSAAPTRRWRLDPLPVILDHTAWSGLEAGLAQRARLLDAVFADLYGPRKLLRHKVIPPEAILVNPGFVRPADGIRLPGPHHLVLTATDLARDTQGRWHVVDDRTASPSGAGYAMQARRIVGRVLPGLYRDTRIQRLRGFFDTLRLALRDVAPSRAEAPRVVILIPGTPEEGEDRHARTPFDHAFLATLLGYPLVTAEDLTVRGGRVYLRSLGRLEPVDVVFRRLGDADADPLELRADSDLGVPGLLDAARRGTVSVVNPIGAAVLESPAVTAYLDAAARALLDEDLLLPTARTLWCGDEGSRAEVLARLGELVISPLARRPGQPVALTGATMTHARLETLRRRIEAEPHAWCAQEPLALATAPIVTTGGLAARRFTLRTFAVGHGGEYRLLTGGLGRLASEVGHHAAPNSSDTPAKDVWVLAATPVAVSSGFTEAPAEPAASSDLAWPRAVAPAAAAAEVLPPRVAENLFRLGQFAERAEDAVRLLRVVDDLTEDWTARAGTPGAATLTVMRRALPEHPVHALVTDPDLPGSVAASIRATVDAAQALREQLSLDTWIVLGSLERVLAEAAGAEDEAPMQPVLARVLEGLLALAGLAAESMVRDLGWAFMDAGRRIERARTLLGVLRSTLDVEQAPAVQAMVVESVLTVGESIITYRRRQPGRSGADQIAAVLDLLLLDRGNPRSVALQLDRLIDDLSRLPGPAALQGRARVVQARLRELDTQQAALAGKGRRDHLVRALTAALADLDALADELTEAHFGHVAPHHATAAIRGWDS